MKKAYVILAFFGIWCLAAAVWYLFSVRDLNSTDPQQAGIAIAEILVMILVSVLLGFGMAWYMREDTLRIKQGDVQALLAERTQLVRELQQLRDRSKKAEHTLSRARQTFHNDYIQVSRDRDRQKEEVSLAREEQSRLKDENMLLQIQLGNEQERSSSLAGKLVETQLQLEAAQQQLVQKEKENSGVRYFINPFNIAATIESSDIDDLKRIKGIGPVIEKKLNMLGIVSFKQISELPEDAIDQISHTLKFFPDRIKRDRWVEQAREFLKSQTTTRKSL